MQQSEFLEIIKQKSDGKLHKRESSTLEFKANFNQGSISEYAKTFSAFANHSGGVVVFGVSDAPRVAQGMSNPNFSNIQIEKVTNFLNVHYSPEIEWEVFDFEVDNKKFGVIKISKSLNKPVVCKNNNDKVQEGDIFYRYSGRSEKIKYPELRVILNETREMEQRKWIDHIQSIAKIGPQNIAILDTLNGELEHKGAQKLLIDKQLLKDIKFLQEGRFVEKDGAPALKLLGSIQAIETVEVVKNEDKLKIYTLSATELLSKVQASLPALNRNKIYK